MYSMLCSSPLSFFSPIFCIKCRNYYHSAFLERHSCFFASLKRSHADRDDVSSSPLLVAACVITFTCILSRRRAFFSGLRAFRVEEVDGRGADVVDLDEPLEVPSGPLRGTRVDVAAIVTLEEDEDVPVVTRPWGRGRGAVLHRRLARFGAGPAAARPQRV